MKIYLIGMPGSGKSTFGKKLAEEFTMQFVDLDKEIEQHEGKTISEIFSQSGEDYFRQVENRLLIQWAASNQSLVMATGGGAPCFYKGIDLMNESGVSVFLDTPIDELIERVKNNRDRPLLNTVREKEMEIKLAALRKDRLDIYQRAHITVVSPNFVKLLNALQLKM